MSPVTYSSSSLLSSEIALSLNTISPETASFVLFSSLFDCSGLSDTALFAIKGLSLESVMRTASSVRIVLLPWYGHMLTLLMLFAMASVRCERTALIL